MPSFSAKKTVFSYKYPFETWIFFHRFLQRVIRGTDVSKPCFSTNIPAHHSTIIPAHHSTIIPAHHSTIIPAHHSTIIPAHHSTIIPAQVQHSAAKKCNTNAKWVSNARMLANPVLTALASRSLSIYQCSQHLEADTRSQHR